MQKRTQKNTKKTLFQLVKKDMSENVSSIVYLGIEAGLSVSNLESILVSKLNFIYLYT